MRYVVAQALVTDPGGTSSAGYAMVGSSPSLLPEDQDALQSRPEITDYLHREGAGESYLSFFPLPSGRFALLFRFVHGNRRGEFNRVVAYTLAVPAEAMEACAFDVDVARACRLVRTDTGSETTVEQLLEEADASRGTLPDLELRPPDAPEAARAELLGAHLVRLLASGFSRQQLQEGLASIYAGLRRGRRVLLDDFGEGRGLLRFSWAALPADDRLQIAWTEHLPPGAAFRYRLGCAPPSEGLALPGALADDWVVLPQNAAPAPGDFAAEGFAAILVKAGHLVHKVVAELERYDISVLDGEDLAHWVYSADWRSQTALGDVLARIGTPRGVHRWIPIDDVVDRVAAHLRERSGDPHSLEEEAGKTLQAIWEHERPWLIAPVTLAAANLSSEAMAYAALLSLRSLPAVPVEADLDHLARLVPRLAPGIARERAVVLLAARYLEQSDGGIESARGLGLSADRIVAVADELEKNDASRPASLARAFRLAYGAGRDAGLRIARHHLVPLWAEIPDDDPTLPGELVPALTVLLDEPEAFAEAMARLRGPRFDKAAEMLRRALQASDRAAMIAAALFPSLGSIPVRSSVRGLAAALRRVGAAEGAWMPFAAAEAASVDGDPHGEGNEFRWLNDVTLSKLAAEQMLTILASGGGRPVWGEYHRALFEAALSMAGAAPEAASRIVAAVAEHGGEAVQRWGGTVINLTREFGDTPEGREVRVSWLRAHTPPLDADMRELFTLLPDERKLEVAQAWTSRGLELKKVDEPTWQAVRLAAAGDPNEGFKYELEALRMRVSDGTLEHLDALREANQRSIFTKAPGESFKAACDQLLPRGPSERDRVVLQAMADPEMWPTSTFVLLDELPAALGRLGAGRLATLALGRPRALALDAARALGHRWREDPWTTLRFVWRVLRRNDPVLREGFLAASGAQGAPPFPAGLQELLQAELDSMSAGRSRAGAGSTRREWSPMNTPGGRG